MTAPALIERPPATPLDRFADHLQRHGALYALAGFTFFIALVYHRIFYGELGGDDLGFHLAETARISDCLSIGDFDLWNPSANAGFASAYYYQSIPLLVPAALTALTGGHLLFWFQLCVFLPLVLAPAAAYRALRVLGASSWAALAGGVAIALSLSNSRWGFGADGTFSVGLYTQTWAFSVFPLALAYGIRFLEQGKSGGQAVAYCLLVGLCHPVAGVALGMAFTVGVIITQLAQWLSWPVRLSVSYYLPSLAATTEPTTPHVLTMLARLFALGALMLIGSASAWLPVLIDYDGFGGFPHRVADEVGPGFMGLLEWFVDGNIFDAGRPAVITILVAISLLLARTPWLRWLWAAAIPYVLLLGLGPHLVTADDLLPGVRFLGPLQIVLALAAASGAVVVISRLWVAASSRRFPLVIRTVLASLSAAAIVVVLITGGQLQSSRVHVAGELEWVHRDEIMVIAKALAAEHGTGRKQARERGAENQWANLLPYTYGRTAALLQMGGGGLQASPNYAFLWEDRDARRNAWIYNAPYVLYTRSNEKNVPPGPIVVETEHLAVRRLPTRGLVSPVTIVGTLPAGRKPAMKAALEWMKSPGPMRDELRQYAGGPPLPAAPEPHGRATLIVRQPSAGDSPDITAQVVAEAPTTFVIRESWHPRWKLFVDGKRVPVRRVTPNFLALDVPSGTHTITARFARPWWAWATWLLIPLAIAMGAVGSRRVRQRIR